MEAIFTRKEWLELQEFGSFVSTSFRRKYKLWIKNGRGNGKNYEIVAKKKLFDSRLFHAKANTLEVYDYLRKSDFNPYQIH